MNNNQLKEKYNDKLSELSWDNDSAIKVVGISVYIEDWYLIS